MPNANPEVIKYCNEVLRPLADSIVKLNYQIQTAKDEYIAKGIAAIMADTSDTITDGASIDGRHIVTGSNMRAVVTEASSIYNSLTASNNLILNKLLLVATNVG
jgi:hypothetical protein